MPVLPKRSEVPLTETWDLTPLFASQTAHAAEREAWVSDSRAFQKRHEGTLSQQVEHLPKILQEWERLLVRMQRIHSYASLAIEVDRTDFALQEQMGQTQRASTEGLESMNFFESEILALPDEVLRNLSVQDTQNTVVWKRFLNDKQHRLNPETEGLLVSLAPVLQLPEEAYLTAKLADLRFPDFTCETQKYPMDFVRFENDYQYETDSAVRRAAFDSFSEQLRTVGNTFATLYAAQVQKEKILATARGYESVFDYLLDQQEVDRAAYERQIDGVYEGLAPIMRRYVQLLQTVWGWDRLTYADLKVPFVTADVKPISLDEAKSLILSALECMGQDYVQIAKQALEERWIDFAHNEGKATGGFCASIYGFHSWILMTWNGLLSEVYTLVHELGHALHSHYAMGNQPYLQSDLSMYLVEAPSTFHELLLSRFLLQHAQTSRDRCQILADMIANTYYHNFVTHLLEAHFQRKVYQAVDRGEVLHFARLNQMMEETLKGFWGDTVEWTPGAELTWMRQPHYYMGLYPYTYSAGLTLATWMYQALETQGQTALDSWKRFLQAGGSDRPLELTQSLLGVDLTAKQPLETALQWIDQAVTYMETWASQLQKEKSV